MTRYRNTAKGRIPFTAEQEAEQDAEEAEIASNQPLNDWKLLMRESDTMDMNRDMEDHITDLHNGNTENQYSQARYNAKLLKRSRKP